MAEPAGLDDLPQATVVPPKRGRISVIWIIPILALLVAVGIAVQRYRSQGPSITIVFKAGEGIEAGKTLIKYKDVTIGRVTAVELTEDFAKVLVRAQIAKHAAGLMIIDAKFWVVRPSISLSGISGLSTLLSGNYIGFQPGQLDASQDYFVGLDVAPVITEQDGRQFVLDTGDLGSLEVGSPIYFRRLQVGQVIAYDLTPDGKGVKVKVFINAPYDKFVFPGTRFWNASGFDVSVGADGVKVTTQSLVALLVGGLAFDTPDFVAQTKPADADSAFTLFNGRDVAMKAPNGTSRRYVLYFNESLRGLSVGAPVTFLGLPAGEVTSVGLAFDVATSKIRPRVGITFYPERLTATATGGGVASLSQDEQKRQSFVRRLFEERGLRAQLKTGSLLTGQLYVAFDYYPAAAKVKVDLTQPEPELPVVPGTLVELEAKLGSILNKIDKLPLDEIAKGIKTDLDELDLALKSARKLVTNADTQLVPPLKANLDDLQRTLNAVERAMKNADTTLLAPDAATQQDLRDALQEFTRAARSVRVLSDQLERQPSSLIRGKTDSTSGGK
jgi:paraquat-inducible protein B